MSIAHQRLRSILLFGVLVFVGSFFVVFGDEDVAKDDDDSGREMREYMPEAWHAVQTIPEGATGWIPRDPVDSPSGIVYTKRRRLRKRKRRPPIVSYLDQSAETVAQVSQDSREEIIQPKESMTNARIEETGHTEAKRTKIPNTGDPWEELQEESVRPYIRRKVTPAYQTSEDVPIITKADNNYNPLSATIQFGPEPSSSSEDSPNKDKDSEYPPVYYRKPITEKEDRFDADSDEISFVPITTTTTTTKKTPNIKEILKQNGGMSLSEILQKKNITLSELLMGKKEAIKALTTAIVTTSTTPIPPADKIPSKDNSETIKYKRLPPSLRKNAINRRYEQYSDPELTDQQMMEAQRKRLALLQGHNYKRGQTGKFSEVTRYEVITEPTTEKRIFVPSHPKLYTSVDYKPDLDDLTANTESYVKSEPSKTETTTQKPTTTTQKTTESTIKYTPTNKASKINFTKSKGRLPVTSAKLMKMTTKKASTLSKAVATVETFAAEEENYPKIPGVPLKAFTINLKDVFGFKNSENQAEEKVPDEPLRMSIDLDNIMDTSTTKTIPEHFIITTPIFSTKATTAEPITIRVPITTTEDIPKLQPYTAKEEILEILKDPLGRAGLARILEARNMTIQELIEQRERGSSQLHLADIFHNKTREPEPMDEALEGKVSSEVFTSFPVFARQPKGLLKQDTTSQKPVESSSQDPKLSVTAFPSFKIEAVKKDPPIINEAFPWQQLYPNLFNIQSQNKDEKPVMVPIMQDPSISEPADILTGEDIQRLEDLEQRIYSSVSSEQLTILDENPQKVANVSSGVKSAIIASLAIVLLSMIVFVTILVVFRWVQKKRQKLHYADSLKPPLFDAKHRSIKTFMAETLGKKKVNYYKRHLQSMSDDIWEREHERKNVF